MISCKKATLLMTIREDRSLTASQRLGLSLHLAECSLCRNYLHQTKLIAEILSKYQLESNALQNFTARLSDKALVSIKKTIKLK